MKTLIGIQDEYIAAVNAGIERWSHRPKPTYAAAGGHAGRVIRGARKKAERELAKLGFDAEQAARIIKDAHEAAELERLSQE